MPGKKPKKKGDRNASRCSRTVPTVGGDRGQEEREGKGQDNRASKSGGPCKMEQTGSAEEVTTAEIDVEKGVGPESREQTSPIKYNKQSTSEESTEFSRSAVILSQYAKNPTEADLRSELRARGEEVLKASRLLSEKYFWLCDWIVTSQIRPEVVGEELKRVGMRKERIAEVKRVCFTSPQIYEEYKSKLIGWKAALEKSRTKRSGKESNHTRWLQLFREVEKQFVCCPPPESFYSGSGKNLFMWSDQDVSSAQLEQSCGRWLVIVRINKSKV